jgi:hypothetical protein
MDNDSDAELPLICRFLDDAGGFWTSRFQHPVQDADSDGNLYGPAGRPCRIVVRHRLLLVSADVVPSALAPLALFGCTGCGYRAAVREAG